MDSQSQGAASFSTKITTSDSRINEAFRNREFPLIDWEIFLRKLVLCPKCNSYFDLSRNSGSCWSCDISYETVDDSHGMGVNAVLAKISGEEDSEAFYIVGENGDGWAYAEWCNLIGKEFDVADEFWNC